MHNHQMLTRASLGDTLITWRVSELTEQQSHHEQAAQMLPLLAQRLEHKANVRVTSVCSLEGVIVDTNRVLVRVGDYLLERTAHQAAALAKEKAGVCTMLAQLLNKGADNKEITPPNKASKSTKSTKDTKDNKSSKTKNQQKNKRRKLSSSEDDDSSSEDYSDDEAEEENEPEAAPGKKTTKTPTAPKNLTSIPEADELELEKPFTIEEELTEADVKKAQMKLQ